jgi:hypothetical protein
LATVLGFFFFIYVLGLFKEESEVTPAQRRKLVGVLGKLGSSFPEERDVAVHVALDMVSASGLTWQQILSGEGGVAEEACRVLLAEVEE